MHGAYGMGLSTYPNSGWGSRYARAMAWGCTLSSPLNHTGCKLPFLKN